MPTAHSLFPYTTLVRSPIERLRLAKSGQVLVRTQKANTPARCGWNADRAQPFLVIATRDASSISDDRQKKGKGFANPPKKQQLCEIRREMLTQPQTSGYYFTNARIK